MMVQAFAVPWEALSTAMVQAFALLGLSISHFVRVKSEISEVWRMLSKNPNFLSNTLNVGFA